MSEKIRIPIALCLPFVFAHLTALPLRGQDDTPFTRLFDTGAVSVQPLADEAVAKRAGWMLVPEDKVDHAFTGDTVLMNDKLVVVLRKQARETEVYSKAANGLKRRANLGHADAGSSTTGALTAHKIIENSSSSVMVEATFKDTVPVTLRLRLTTGESILEVRPGAGAGAVVVQSQTRYVVVPDYFGDDMVFETGALSPNRSSRREEALTSARKSESLLTSAATAVTGGWNLYLPSENMCLNLLDGGDAILMTVWQSSEQDAWLTPAPDLRAPSPPSGERDGVRGRGLPLSNGSTALHVQCLPGKSIWLAFLESPGLWHAGTATAKVAWTPPFPAKWRCSLVRENGVADSWATEKPDGIAPERSADFSPLPSGQAAAKRAEARAPDAPLLIYPIDRSAATPLTAVCPTDVMRNTLGVGPCQYILACEGMAAQGDPTPNSVMNWVEKQFEQKKDRKTSDDIKERLEVMVQHIGEARTKIEGYASFARQVRQVVSGKPGVEDAIAILADLDRFAATGLAATATPQRARQLADEVAALIGKENAAPACQRLGEQLRSIGTVQDGALARSRMAVRRLKQQGRTLAANQAQGSGVPQEVQRLAEQMLQKK